MKKEVSKKKTTKKTIQKQDKALIITFVGLIVLVIALAIVALNMKTITDREKANIVIPILEENSENVISIELNDMVKEDVKEYIFVVSNFKDKEILKKSIEYDVDVTPTENTTVKVYKNSSNDNLLTEDDLLIENNKFKAKKKTEDTYKVVITAKEKPTETEKITLKINS